MGRDAMMTCAEFDAHVDGYLDHRLSRDDIHRVRGHLDRCGSCREIVTAQQESLTLLRTAVADVATAVDVSGIWARVSEAIDRQPVEADSAWRRLFGRAREWLSVPLVIPMRPAAWTGGLAVAGLAVLFLFGGGSMEPDRTASTSKPATRQTRPAASNPRYTANVRIDNLETAPGHAVATWTQPRTGSRVIWVASTDVVEPTEATY